SEESEGETGLGNVNRLIVRPAGQSGKAKRGHLCFDAAFECGNLGRADHVSDIEYDLYVRPDTCRPRSRVRIPRRLIFYHKSILHRGHKILSIAFAFDREEDIYSFTASAPYSYSRLQKHLTMWEKRADAFATRESIAQSTVIPMLNPDGVFLGNQRSDLLGADLNRSWDNATKLAHPGLIAVNGLIEKLTTEGKGIKLDFIIDIHADISHEGVFVRGNSYDDVGSARRALPVGAVDAYTLLASLGGRRLTARGPYIHYTEDACILSTK
ncbi:Cytosolic carboxypeptidase 6, partial [Operophtera brumata]